MEPGAFRFDRFRLDPGDRQLSRDDAPVTLNARYLDALALLVREQGKLVSKDRFLEEVWRGAPVTDEALTQCIKTLRRQLGDDAASPRFIETVPKHGYRFIAPVERVAHGPVAGAALTRPRLPWRQFLLIGGAGTIGGGATGVFVGLFYGLGGVSRPLQAGMGAVSILLVLLCVSVVLGLVAGSGVGFGIAAAGFMPRRPWLWSTLGGAAGGLMVGGLVKLIGLDAFNLLFGRSPGDITGAAEGLLIGGAIGLAAWWASRGGSGRRIVVAALATGAVGLLIPMLGGRLMGGSLELLVLRFPGSRLRLDQIGALFGEQGFGPVSQVATGGLESAVFGGCVVGAMILARRRWGAGV